MPEMTAEVAIQKMMTHAADMYEDVVKKAKRQPSGLASLAETNRLMGSADAYKEMFDFLKLLESFL